MMAEVRVRLYAAARAAAGGRDELAVDAPDLAGLREEMCAAFGPPMSRVLPSCSYLLDGVAVARGDSRSLSGVRSVDVLPPFAGG